MKIKTTREIFCGISTYFTDKHMKREHFEIKRKSMLKQLKGICSDVTTKNDDKFMFRENENTEKAESENSCYSLHRSILQ